MNKNRLYFMLALICMMVGILTGLIWSQNSNPNSKQENRPQPKHQNVTSGGNASTSQPIDSSAPLPPSNPSIWNAFFQNHLFQMTQEDVQNTLGVAHTTSGPRETYILDGCHADVLYQDGKVHNVLITFEEASCQINLTTLGLELPHADKNLTFGQLRHALGDETWDFQADCLIHCGNAMDASIFAHYQGPNLPASIQVAASTVQVNETLDAATLWQQTMRQEQNENWLTNKQFNCSDQYNLAAQTIFKQVAVSALHLGYDLPKQTCDTFFD